ncbi:hypothetical protein BKK81_33475 (plasmid) [Cupriavidus sp. USMAHM13]|nr:hypothetical protein BKK81_33475 [Cupriavidus sp. USMAHM13]
MIGLEDRQTMVRHIEAAQAAGARLRLACEVAGITVRTLQRWKAHDGLMQAAREPDVHPRKRKAQQLATWRKLSAFHLSPLVQLAASGTAQLAVGTLEHRARRHQQDFIGRIPTRSLARWPMSARIRPRAALFRSRVSASTTKRLVTLRPSVAGNTATPPLRTPPT